MFLDILKKVINIFINTLLKRSEANHTNNSRVDKDQAKEIDETEVAWSHYVIETKVTSPFGKRKHPYDPKKTQFHNGTDYTGRGNKYAKAPCDCIIEKVVAPDPKYPYKYVYDGGKFVYTSPPKGRAWTPYMVLRALHNPNLKFIYRHGENLSPVGTTVWCGQDIYLLDNYGFSKGIHLHVEVLLNDKEIDPDAFIKEKIMGA